MPVPQHILKLSPEERCRFVDSFERVFSDIDGVIINLGEKIPNVHMTYAALERAGKQLTFVTNNSVRTVDETVEKFGKCNLSVSPDQIWHPAQTLIHYLRSIDFDGLIYIMASPPFKALLREAGYQLLDGPNQFIKESYQDLAHNIFDKEPVRAVVIDVDFNLNSPKLLRAHRYLERSDCLFFTGATDRLLPVGKGIKIIGPGAFCSVLSEASAREPIVLGKPGRTLGDLMVKQYKISDPSRVLMIGDMLEQDVRFGRICGFQTLLVLTGGCTLEQLQAETDPDLLPDYYADSVADLAELLGEKVTKADG